MVERSGDAGDNPPILTDDVTDTVRADKQHADGFQEYFIPKTEYKTKLGKDDENEKSGQQPGVVKIFCWIMSSLLLTGAIILAVLIGSKYQIFYAKPCKIFNLILVGIIDTTLDRNIKVSRELRPENITQPGQAQLMEVKVEDVPNVLTNDPEFFTKKKGKVLLLKFIFKFVKTFSEVFDGELRIMNIDWDSNLENKTSFEYQELAEAFERELDTVLNTDEAVNMAGRCQFVSRVQELAPGSVVVMFSIEVSSHDQLEDNISPALVSESIIRNVENIGSGSMLGRFIIDTNSLSIVSSSNTPHLSVSQVLDEDNLEKELHNYEREIFSKPNLESITQLVDDDTSETTTTQVETTTKTENVIESNNNTTAARTFADNEDTEKTNFTSKELNTDDEDIIATTDAEIILESEDEDQLDVEIESRTNVYDEIEISDKIHSEYSESTTEQTSVTLELEYFRESVDDTESEAADEDYNDYVTTDANLELNTINSLIVNA